MNVSSEVVIGNLNTFFFWTNFRNCSQYCSPLSSLADINSSSFLKNIPLNKVVQDTAIPPYRILVWVINLITIRTCIYHILNLSSAITKLSHDCSLYSATSMKYWPDRHFHYVVLMWRVHNLLLFKACFKKYLNLETTLALLQSISNLTTIATTNMPEKKIRRTKQMCCLSLCLLDQKR